MNRQKQTRILDDIHTVKSEIRKLHYRRRKVASTLPREGLKSWHAKCDREHQKHEQRLKKHKLSLRSLGIPLPAQHFMATFLVATLLGLIIVFNPAYTGLSIQDEKYTADIYEIFNESTAFNLSLNHTPGSLRITGTLFGEGHALVRVGNKVILNTSLLDKVKKSVTGLAVAAKSEKSTSFEFVCVETCEGSDLGTINKDLIMEVHITSGKLYLTRLTYTQRAKVPVIDNQSDQDIAEEIVGGILGENITDKNSRKSQSLEQARSKIKFRDKGNNDLGHFNITEKDEKFKLHLSTGNKEDKSGSGGLGGFGLINLEENAPIAEVEIEGIDIIPDNFVAKFDEITNKKIKDKEEITTKVFAAHSLNFAAANITLPIDKDQNGSRKKINAIIRCEEFDVDNFECERWKPTDIAFTDNGDSISFTVDHFSGYAGASIDVLNVKSYPQQGGAWSVAFNTTGVANLTITAYDTTWDDDLNPAYDLQFISLKCGEDLLTPDFIEYENDGSNSSVFYENYNCSELGAEVSKVISSGPHHLEFKFGTDVGYAHNDASNWNISTADVGLTGGCCGDPSKNVGQYSSIDALNASDIWIAYHHTNDAAAASLIVQNTSDRGATWSNSTVDTTGGSGINTDIQVIDKDTIYVVHGDSTNQDIRFANSTDGGKTWGTQKLDDSPFVTQESSISAISSSHIFVAWIDENDDAKVKVSTDSSATWSEYFVGSEPSMTETISNVKLYTFNSSHVYAAFINSSGGSKGLQFANSSNGGQNWDTSIIVSNNFLGTISELGVNNTTHMWIAYEDATFNDNSINIANTSNGGLNWDTVKLETGGASGDLVGEQISLKVIDGSSIVIAYNNQTSGGDSDLKFANTTDGGANWNKYTIDGTGDTGAYPGIDAINDTLIFISYWNDTADSLDFAKHWTEQDNTADGGGGGGPQRDQILVTAINSPLANQNYTTGATVVFNATVVNNTTVAIDNVTFQITNGSNPTFNLSASNSNKTLYNASFAASGLSEGNHTLTVYANLSNGTINDTETTTFIYDVTGPDKPEIHYPLNNVTISVSSVQFNFSVNDSYSPSMNCDLVLDDSTNTSASAVNGTLTTITVSGLSEAYHNFTVNCNDTVNLNNVSLASNFTIVIPPKPSGQWNTSLVDVGRLETPAKDVGKYSDISALNSTHIWISYTDGTNIVIANTTDSGVTWSNKSVQAGGLYTEVKAVNKNTIYGFHYHISTASLRFVNSSNGGASYDSAVIDEIGTSTVSVNVHVFNATNIYTSVLNSSLGLLYINSTDAGKTWTNTSMTKDPGTGNTIGKYASVHAFNESHIFAAYKNESGASYSLIFSNSSDGGSTWEPKFAVAPASIDIGYIAPIGFINTSDIWIVYENTTTGDKAIWLANTSNGGNTWSTQRMVSFGSSDQLGTEINLVVLNGTDIYTVYDNLSSSAYSLQFINTTDGGKSWNNYTITEYNNTGQYASIDAINETLIFISHYNESVDSLELAKHYVTQDPNSPPQQYGACYNVTCTTAVDDLAINGDTCLCGSTVSGSDAGSSGFIIINASHVTVLCNGTTINGTASGSGIYMTGKTNVTIWGCNITNFSDGIDIDGTSSDITIRDNILKDNADGIDFGIIGSGSINITNNTIANNTEDGIRKTATGAYGGNIVINNNIIETNLDDGLGMASSSGEWGIQSLITNNTIQHNGDDGVENMRAKNQINFTNNIVFNNSGKGVHLQGDSTSTRITGYFQNNNISQNSGSATDYGLLLEDAEAFVITSNSFNNNTNDNIVFDNVIHTKIDGNDGNNMSNVVDVGITIQTDTTDNLTIANLNITGAVNQGIQITGGATLILFRNNLTNNKYGISYNSLAAGKFNISNNYIGNNTLAGIYKSSTGSEAGDLIIMNNLIERNTDGLDVSSISSEMANNIDFINNTVHNNGDDGVTRLIAITAINVSYNTIYANNGSGILIDGDSTITRIKPVNISNNNISENHGASSDFGMEILDAEEVFIRSNSLHNNTGHQLIFSNVQDAKIDGDDGNNFSTSVDIGILIEGLNSDNVTVVNLNISGGSSHGIELTSGKNITLSNNNITGHNYGISYNGLDGGVINITGNYIANHTLAGIYKTSTTDEAADFVFENNKIEKNTDGLDVSSTTTSMGNNIDFHNNIVQENGDDGVAVLIAVTGINATYNTVFSNNGSGILIDGDSTINRIKGNFHNNNISENHGSGTDYGVKILDADEYTLTSNNIHNNTGYQLIFSNTQDSIIDGTTGNNMSTTVNYGILIEGLNSDNITVSNLTISGGNNEGIDLTSGKNITIYRNHIMSQLNGIAYNGLDGGYLNISNNYIAYNSQDGIAKSSTTSEVNDLIIEANTIENNVDGISGNSVSYESGNSLILHNNIIQANSDDGVESLTLTTDINATSNTINNNSGKGIHLSGDSTISRATMIFQHNNVTENTGASSDWGVKIEDVTDLNFFNNTLDHNTGDGLELDNVRFGSIKTSSIKNSSIYGVVIVNSQNTTVINSTITGSGTATLDTSTNSNTSLIDSTYDENFTIDSGNFVQFEWWVDIQVENQSGVIENANVTVHDINGTMIFNRLTDANGLVSGLNLTEYVSDDLTNATYVNYTIKANISSHSNNTTGLNLTLTNSTKIYLNLTGNAPSASNAAPAVGVVNTSHPITLAAGTITLVYCNATLTDTDGYSEITSANATLFDSITSSNDAADDNNSHYTNRSCTLQGGTGNTIDANCTFEVAHHANNSTLWACNISTTDGTDIGTNGTGKQVTVNQLAAIGVSPIIYSDSGGNSVALGGTSNESSLTITNLGNIRADIKLNGSDSDAVVCRIGSVSQTNQKYNTSSGFEFNSGTSITTTQKQVGNFNVTVQTNDAVNSTSRLYWLLKLPSTGVQGPCNGSIQVATV